MGVKRGFIPLFTEGQIDKDVDKFVDEIEDQVIKVFQYVGETFVNDARSIRTYNDVTGNLRASIGYVVAVDTTTVGEDISGGDRPRAVGISTAKSLTNRLKKGKGIALIGVAGMHYSRDVEARGRDVITKSQIRAKALLRDLIKEI